MRLYGETLITFHESSDRKKKISQDIIDAVLIGTVALAKLRIALQTQVDFTQAFLPVEGPRSGGRRMSWSESQLKAHATKGRRASRS